MRRFGIASIVLAVVGALLSMFAGPETSKPQVAARSQIVTPVKKALAQRRSKRAWIVLAERVGEIGNATRGAAYKVALIGQPQAAMATLPVARGRATAPAQVAPAAPTALPVPKAAVQDQAASVDYLPPSSMRQKASPGGTDEAAASKPKPRPKYSTRQTGTGVVYRTQQTSGQQRGSNDYGSRERGQRERGHGARSDSPYATWGW